MTFFEIRTDSFYAERLIDVQALRLPLGYQGWRAEEGGHQHEDPPAEAAARKTDYQISRCQRLLSETYRCAAYSCQLFHIIPLVTNLNRPKPTRLSCVAHNIRKVRKTNKTAISKNVILCVGVVSAN